jgi:acetyl-CoA synthetase
METLISATDGATYDDLRSAFRWQLPLAFNIGALCADRHPRQDLALIELDEEGRERRFSFGDLTDLSNRLANAMTIGLGIRPGDRVAIILPQSVENGLTHLACYKCGAIALPLSGLFGPDALEYRLGDSEAAVVVTDSAHMALAVELATGTGTKVVCVDRDSRHPLRFWTLVEDASGEFDVHRSGPDAPVLLIYTSGTTGSPKGTLHGQRVLFGHLPGFELSHNFFGRADDRFWTPADWAWIGGLLDALLPTWFHGRSVVSTKRAKFDPEWALDLISRQGIRNVFLPPTALKVMRQNLQRPDRTSLRTIGCGGEPLGDEILAWTKENLGVEVNEFYGQTEANLLVGNSSAVWPVKPGSMGLPYPGHDVAILRTDGSLAETGEVGQVAVRSPDPVMFLEYWRKPEATAEKMTADGAWLLTGDLAHADDDGYLWYASRDDDVITSAGYRIGPAEIEACLMRHPGVASAAAIGVPDPVRGEVVKVFIVPTRTGDEGSDFEAEIRGFVRTRLATYLYPRFVEFTSELPLTTTGKIRRAELRDREIRRSGVQSGGA